jgi:uncharacterized membrane protein YfcA
MIGLVVAASLTAFLGSFIGARLTNRVTFETVQLIVGIMLMILGLAIFLGIA